MTCTPSPPTCHTDQASSLFGSFQTRILECRLKRLCPSIGCESVTTLEYVRCQGNSRHPFLTRNQLDVLFDDAKSSQWNEVLFAVDFDKYQGRPRRGCPSSLQFPLLTVGVRSP